MKSYLFTNVWIEYFEEEFGAFIVIDDYTKRLLKVTEYQLEKEYGYRIKINKKLAATMKTNLALFLYVNSNGDIPCYK